MANLTNHDAIRFIVTHGILRITQIMKLTEEAVRNQLEEVIDPELNISIVDLGLVYQIKLKKGGKVYIQMTLTSLGCPLYETIENDIENALKKIGVSRKNVEIDLTFDPPWSMDTMSERAKAMLGI